MPYFIEKKSMFTFIGSSKLTPYLGPWIIYPSDQKYSTKLGFEKEVCAKIIESLPSFDKFLMAFTPNFTNWLPFFWQGFKQTTHYTYIIKNDNKDVVFNNFL